MAYRVGMTPDEPEDDLIAAAKAGSERAFTQLVETYQDYLYRLMVRACHHPQDAEEVASAAFARAHERLAQFEGRSRFVSWVATIATRLCFRRREKRELPAVSLEATDADGEALPLPAATDPTPEQEALRREAHDQVMAAVAELPEPGRTVLALRDIEALSTAEVVRQTGLSEGAVKSQLHRARVQLRERLNRCFLG